MTGKPSGIIERRARRRREAKQRQLRIHKYVEQIRELEGLAARAETKKQVSQIRVRIRTLRQQVRYMGYDL